MNSLRPLLIMLAWLLALLPAGALASIPRNTFTAPPLPLASFPHANPVAAGEDSAPLTLHLDGLHDGGVLVRQNPWSAFDPEGLFLFGLFDSAGDYGHEVGEVFKGYGDVTVGALVATARAIVELPRNTMGVVNDLAEMSQMDSAHVAQGVENAATKGFQDAKQAASDYGDRLANGDNRAWGQVVGTVLTVGGAKGAQFAKVAEVAETGEAGAAAARAAAEVAKKSGECFPAGTLVSTPEGEKPIERLKEGEQVYAFDFERGEVVPRTVLKTYLHFTYCWVDIQAGDETIAATRGHRFWVEPEQKWIAALELQPGMKLRLEDARTVIIAAVRIRKLEQPEATFNLEVAHDHNYFVGGSQVLVHNGDFEPVGGRDTVSGSRRAAMREAKRASGIPTSQTHDTHRLVPDRQLPGKKVIEYDFTTPKSGGGTQVQTVPDHLNGHPKGKVPPHFNDTNGGHHIYKGC